MTGLFGGVDDRDVADAVVRALAYEPAKQFETFNVMAAVPWEDADAFARDPAAMVGKHSPETTAMGFDIPSLIRANLVWRSDRARRELAWRARYGFGAFLEAHRRGDHTHNPDDGESQWSV